MTDEKKTSGGYNAAYYEKNREKLSQKRKERYANDPVYAQRAREKSAEYKRLRSARKDKEPADRSRKPVEVQTANGVADGYTIGYLVERLERPKVTINSWLANNAIPDTPYRNGAGERLWTLAMMDVLKREIGKRGRISKGDKSLFSDILAGWKKHGVTAAA